MKNLEKLGAKVTIYMSQAINKLEAVLEQVDKGIGKTVNALDLVEKDLSTTVKKTCVYSGRASSLLPDC